MAMDVDFGNPADIEITDDMSPKDAFDAQQKAHQMMQQWALASQLEKAEHDTIMLIARNI